MSVTLSPAEMVAVPPLLMTLPPLTGHVNQRIRAAVQLPVLDQSAGPVVFQYNMLFWAWADDAAPMRSTAAARPKNPV